MSQLIIPEKLLNPSEMDVVVSSAVEKLLENHSAVEGYVILAQMEKLLEATKERIKEKAIAGVQGKEMDVMGAKVTTRRSVTWEYDSPTLAKLSLHEKEVKEKIKAHKKALESGATVVSEEGQIETAIKVKDGITIAVSLPKEEK